MDFFPIPQSRASPQEECLILIWPSQKVPAVSYGLNFAPNPNWSHFYSGGDEIGKYCDSVVENFELAELMSFNSSVLSAEWNEDDGLWHFTIDKDGELIHDTAHVFFNGSGFTTEWVWPNIPGIETFKGKLVHPADWDDTYDYRGKKVALLGNGSTAIQILPAMQEHVKHMVTFVRSPTWLTPGFAAQFTREGDGANFAYSDEEHALWNQDPEKYHELRKIMEQDFNMLYSFTTNGSKLQKDTVAAVRKQMEETLKDIDPEIKQRLIPDWPIGCRRIT